MDSHERQLFGTVWNDCSSEIFETKNGIKQGSIASPVLCTVYMNQLLNRLEKSGLGCRIRAYYYGAFGYADDLMLLIPIVNGLQKMVNFVSNTVMNIVSNITPLRQSQCILVKRNKLILHRLMMLA